MCVCTCVAMCACMLCVVYLCVCMCIHACMYAWYEYVCESTSIFGISLQFHTLILSPEATGSKDESMKHGCDKRVCVHVSKR